MGWVAGRGGRADSVRRFLLVALLGLGCRAEEDQLADRIDFPREVVELGGAKKLAFSSALGERIRVEVQVPAREKRPVLNLSTAVEAARAVPRARVSFRVGVVADGFRLTLHERIVRFDGQNRWDDHAFDLAAWAGRRVTLELEARAAGGARETPWASRVRALWGEPAIASRDAPRNAGKLPSVILIVVDALRYDYLGVNGFVGGISPNLDWLALESVRFESAISVAPWTKPSIASVLTGLHPETHGVLRLRRDRGEALPERAVTLAEVFRENGYRTAAFVGNALLSPGYGFEQGFETYVVDRRDRLLLEELRTWLDSVDEAPYFVYLHLIGAHGPYRAPEADYRLLRSSPSLGAGREILPGDPQKPDHLEMTPFASPGERKRVEAWRAKYAAAVRKVDRYLGELLGELRRSGELDRSVVVLTSDHGEEFLEHPSWEHGYELCSHQLHVPLWFRLPGAERAGSRIESTFSLVDLMPTLLGLARLPVPSRAQGEDASRWVEEPGSAQGSGNAFASGMLGNPTIRSMFTDLYRLEWSSETGTRRLFDRRADPAEIHDRSGLERSVVKRLEGRLLEHLATLSAEDTLNPVILSIPESLREELRALGYLPGES